jgi:hypothetical protein
MASLESSVVTRTCQWLRFALPLGFAIRSSIAPEPDLCPGAKSRGYLNREDARVVERNVGTPRFAAALGFTLLLGGCTINVSATIDGGEPPAPCTGAGCEEGVGGDGRNGACSCYTGWGGANCAIPTLWQGLGGSGKIGARPTPKFSIGKFSSSVSE